VLFWAIFRLLRATIPLHAFLRRFGAFWQFFTNLSNFWSILSVFLLNKKKNEGLGGAPFFSANGGWGS
jgi:hypothetical protein